MKKSRSFRTEVCLQIQQPNTNKWLLNVYEELRTGIPIQYQWEPRSGVSHEEKLVPGLTRKHFQSNPLGEIIYKLMLALIRNLRKLKQNVNSFFINYKMVMVYYRQLTAKKRFLLKTAKL